MEIQQGTPQDTQTRKVLLNDYAASGGRCEEKVYAGKGHSPYLYEPAMFIADLKAFVTERTRRGAGRSGAKQR